jgi:hypothetical protein
MRRALIAFAALCLAACAGQPQVAQRIDTPPVQVAMLGNFLAGLPGSVAVATCTTNGSDGYAGAPVAVIQYPTLLDTYTAAGHQTPHTDASPWCVAGVDFAVGYASATVLTDWQTYVTALQATYGTDGSGIDLVGTNPANIRVRYAPGGITFDKIDFSLHGGATVAFLNSPNGSITNSNFGGGNYANQNNIIYADANSPGLTVKYNIIDGSLTSPGMAATQAQLIYASGGGAVTIQYNWFKNYGDPLGVSAATPLTLDYRFNLIDNSNQPSGAHQNWLDFANGTVTSPIVAYNTAFQNALGGAEGFQWYIYGSGQMSSPVLANNVEIALPSGGSYTMSYMNHGSDGQQGFTVVTGLPIAENNYMDPSGTIAGNNIGVFYPSSFQTFSGQYGNGPAWTFANQWNMATGSPISNTPP